MANRRLRLVENTDYSASVWPWKRWVNALSTNIVTDLEAIIINKATFA